jgi:hypothetical protein
MVKTILNKMAVVSIAAVCAGSAFATTTVTTNNTTAQPSTVAFGKGALLSCSTGTTYDSWSSTSGQSPNGVTNSSDQTVATLGGASKIGLCALGGCNVVFYSDDHCGTQVATGKISYSNGVITVTQPPAANSGVTIDGSGTDSITMNVANPS